MYTQFQDSKIYYTHEGSGNPLVLLHGFLESSNIWKEWFTEFARHRKIVCIDLPGHGRSQCIGKIHSMEMMAEVILIVLEELKIDQATFAGHSMGGYVLLSFLEKSPEYVKNIVLLNSTPAADSLDRKMNRERSVHLVRKNKSSFINMALNNLLPPEAHQKFSHELDIMKRDALRFSVEGIVALLEGMKIRTDKSQVLRSFKGEKYFIAGRNDPILDFEGLKSVAEATDSRFIPVPGGHMSLIESKEEIKKIVYFIE